MGALRFSLLWQAVPPVPEVDGCTGVTGALAKGAFPVRAVGPHFITVLSAGDAMLSKIIFGLPFWSLNSSEEAMIFQRITQMNRNDSCVKCSEARQRSSSPESASESTGWVMPTEGADWKPRTVMKAEDGSDWYEVEGDRHPCSSTLCSSDKGIESIIKTWVN